MKSIDSLLPIGAVAITVIASVTLFSQSQSIPTTQPDGNIAIPITDGSMLVQMVGTTSTLHVLLRSRMDGEIVRLDSQGRILDRTPVHRQTLSFAVAPTGAVTTLRRHGPKSFVSGPLFDSLRPITEREVPAALERLTILGGRPVGVEASSISTDLNLTETGTIPLNVLAPHRTTPLPDGSLAIIASKDPTLWKLDAGGHLSAPVKLIAPELEHFQPSDTHLAVYDAVSLRNGDLILAASPYNPEEGARLVRFDANGNLKTLMRLLMPEFPELVGIAGGRLRVSKLAM